MNPYSSFDKAEEHRDLAASIKQQRDEWVREKADELSALFPELVTDFASPFGSGKFYVKLIGDDDAQEAYATFVDTFCLAKAERMARENEFTHGSYQEVA